MGGGLPGDRVGGGLSASSRRAGQRDFPARPCAEKGGPAVRRTEEQE